jgi:DNA helicase-4
MKCDECRDGYLIVKPSKDNNYFLGCTNYKKDGTGCGKIVWKKQYYDMFGLEPDVEADVSPKTYNKTTETKTTYEEKSDEDSICIEKTKLKTGVYYEKNELNNTIHTILLCLSEISKNKYYGTTTLIDVLRGSKSKKIITAGLDLVSTYAQLQTISRDDLLTIIEWMIDNKLILKTNHPTYPVLHPTYEGQHYGEFVTVGKLKKLLSVLNKEM